MLREIITTFMLLVFLVGCGSPTGADSSPELKTSIHTDVPATDIARSTSTLFPPQTDTPIPPTWVVIDNWNSVNQIRTMLIDRSGDLWAGGPGGLVHWDLETDTPTVYGINIDPESPNVVGLTQTPDGAL